MLQKRFLASEREILIQDQALTRNVDSQIHPTDSIVAYFNSTFPPRRLLQQYLPEADKHRCSIA
jgi:hypothetical protein